MTGSTGAAGFAEAGFARCAALPPAAAGLAPRCGWSPDFGFAPVSAGAAGRFALRSCLAFAASCARNSASCSKPINSIHQEYKVWFVRSCRAAHKLRRHAGDPSAADAEHYGPHRARHSVFRHPATMPDKAGVEVYRYARRPVDSLVCVGPIRGTGNASMRSCCALYGYVSGSHAVHSLAEIGAIFRAAIAPAAPIDARHGVFRLGTSNAIPRHRCVSAPAAILQSGQRRRLRANQRSRQSIGAIPVPIRQHRCPHATRCVRIHCVAHEEPEKCVVWPDR